MAAIELSNIVKRFGATTIVDALSLSIEPGELVVLVGPSGCGKSTLLRIIAGLLTPDAGTVRIAGRDVTFAAPGERDVAMVFQSYALYPHMTVFENIAFPLRVRRVAASEVAQKVTEVAASLGLRDLLQRLPRELSGGQRQRVAMGRAIVREPKAFLFDEPLSNLDASLRAKMRAEIAALHRRLGATMVYVTHDQHEAMTLADRLVLLDRGRIVQAGAPLSVYERPASRFAAEFLGSPAMNFLPVVRRGQELVGSGFVLPATTIRGATSVPEAVPLLLGVRPEALSLATSATGIVAVADWVERTGSDGYLYAKVGEVPVVVRLPAEAAREVEVGKPVQLRCGEAHLFEQQSGRALS